MKQVLALSLTLVALGCGDDGADGAPGFPTQRRFAAATYPPEPSTNTLCRLVVGEATSQSFRQALGEPFQSYDFVSSRSLQFAYAQAGSQVPKLLSVDFNSEGVFEGKGSATGMLFPRCWSSAAVDEFADLDLPLPV